MSLILLVFVLISDTGDLTNWYSIQNKLKVIMQGTDLKSRKQKLFHLKLVIGFVLTTLLQAKSKWILLHIHSIVIGQNKTILRMFLDKKLGNELFVSFAVIYVSSNLKPVTESQQRGTCALSFLFSHLFPVNLSWV